MKSRAIVFILIGLVLVLAASAVGLSLRQASVLTGLQGPEGPVSALATNEVADYGASGTIGATLSSPPAITSPQLAGVVTQIAIKPGDVLVPGSTILSVDGVAAKAYSDDGIFYRSLTYGDRGDDVAALQRVLSTQFGIRITDALGRFAGSTRSAVRALAASVGAPADGTFQPQWLVRLPTVPFTVSAVDLQLGTSAPSLGGNIAEGTRTIETIDVSYSGGGPDGDYVFQTPAGSQPMTFKGGTWTFVDPASAALLFASAPTTSKTQSVDGYLALKNPARAVGVAPSAIVTSSNRTCVLVVMAGGYQPVRVTLAGNSYGGKVLISSGALTAGTRVILNPGVLRSGSKCPSS